MYKLDKIIKIYDSYHSGKLGDLTMPEDTVPVGLNFEERLNYYTLPMSLNYQRNSFKLWEAAKSSYEDSSTKSLFDLEFLSKSEFSIVQNLLKVYKLGLQPNQHTKIYKKISNTLFTKYITISNLLELSNYDFLKLKEIVTVIDKKDFPYLSGPKIFNYWSHILQRYCDIKLVNTEYIEIAPDTHVLQASIKLGVISEFECSLSAEEISKRWRDLLSKTNITPIEMHSPLWFWSRGGFIQI